MAKTINRLTATVPLNRHPGMLLAGIQWLSSPWLKTLDSCLRRNDVEQPSSRHAVGRDPVAFVSLGKDAGCLPAQA